MSRVAGLELDQDAVRVAIFDGSSKKFSLVDFIDESLEGESPEERAEHLEQFLTELRGRKENRGLDFVTCLDSRRTTLREISVPFVRDEQINKTVRFEAEGYLHALSIDDVIIEYLKCSSTEDSSRLLICAAPKATLSERLEGLRALGVEPTVIELDATALATAYSNTPLYSEDQNVLIVHADEHSTRLVFLQKGRLVKIRSVWSQKGIPAAREGAVAEAGVAPGSSEMPSAPSSARGGEAGDESQAVFSESVDLQDEIARRFEAIERSLEGLDQEDDAGEEMPFVVLSDDDYAALQSEPEDGSEASDGDALGEELTDLTAEAARRGPGRDAGDPLPTESASEGDDPHEEQEEKAPAVPPSAIALARFAPSDPLEKLILEIERTFASYVLNDSIDLIVVSGNQARHLELASRLEEHFEVDTTSFDLGDSFPVTWEGDRELLSERGVVACGLGLRALGRGLTTFDLRKEEFRYERRFARLMPSLALLGMLLCVAGLVWTLHGRNDYMRLLHERVALEGYQDQVSTTFLGEKVSNAPVVADYSAAMKRKLNEIQRGGGKVTQYASAAAMFADIADAVAKAQPPIYWKVTDFDLKPELRDSSRSKVDFTVDTAQDAERVVQAISRYSEFFGTPGMNKGAGREGGYDCTMTLSFKPEKYASGR